MSRVQTAKSQQNIRSIEEELEHQIKKSGLLDADRKNFYNNAEETKRKNNEIIEQLKKENRDLKKLQDELIANKRGASASLAKTQGAFISWSGDIKDENYWRRKLDDAKHLTKAKKERLIQLQDKLNEVSDTKFGVPEESPLMRQIRILENNLDKVMIKYNEAQSIRKTYEQIVKRLKEERVGYDNQLAAIERSLKGKEHDYEELLLLAHDATHAKELAQAELKKYEHKKAAVRELRKTYLDAKRKAIEEREKVIQKLEKREKDNVQTQVEYNTSNIPIQESSNPNVDTNIQKQKLADYEEAFHKLKEATGFRDVNDIIQKFTSQDETSKSLSDLKGEYQDKIEQLVTERQKLRDHLNDLKYEGGEALTRKQIDEIENNVNNAINKCERTKLKYERVQKILVNVKAGIEHLYEKLEFFKLEGKPNIVISDETLVDGLSQVVEKMKLVLQLIKNDASYRAQDFKQTWKDFNKEHIDQFINLNLRDNNIKPENVSRNIRVRIQDKEDDDVSDGEIEDDIDQEVTAKLKQKYGAQAKDKNAKKLNKPNKK
ncbi:unnamed protein product [Paramecium primaurelia]|uniref:ODAD1 central coiled coil region domain-containing protein n=1 Tax=Paramecium primaurelia TaxID=5886 RepID=A0A8S1LVF7_PARPR|nr:unnamed protein product [Paramecium primaurelia]